MKNNVYYDDSLRLFTQAILQFFDKDFLLKNLFLRDASGKLTFILKDSNYSIAKLKKLKPLVEDKLKSYIEPGFSICESQELYDDEIEGLVLNEKTERRLEVNAEIVKIHYYERRIIGGDWQRFYSDSNGPARLVFASVKGGVGRSTALCVCASALARAGKRILTIDLDLEAPGLGNMLLTNETLPAFGLLDYFVESNLNNINEEFLVDMVGSSWFSFGKGRIDVIPAIGKKSLTNPGNVIAKISRAYLPGLDSDGNISTFMDNLRNLLDLIDPGRYDAVLIDSRAGLHETTASALVGLGAEIFCFGVNQPQTFSGYELLFSSMRNDSPILSSDANWLDKLNFIHAKAPADENKRRLFNEKIEAVISKSFSIGARHIPELVNIDDLKDSFEVEWNEDVGDEVVNEIVLDGKGIISENKEVIPVFNDERYIEFNPLSDKDSLNETVYNSTFETLIKRVFLIVEESLSKNYELG